MEESIKQCSEELKTVLDKYGLVMIVQPTYQIQLISRPPEAPPEEIKVEEPIIEPIPETKS